MSRAGLKQRTVACAGVVEKRLRTTTVDGFAKCGENTAWRFWCKLKNRRLFLYFAFHSHDRKHSARNAFPECCACTFACWLHAAHTQSRITCRDNKGAADLFARLFRAAPSPSCAACIAPSPAAASSLEAPRSTKATFRAESINRKAKETSWTTKTTTTTTLLCRRATRPMATKRNWILVEALTHRLVWRNGCSHHLFGDAVWNVRCVRDPTRWLLPPATLFSFVSVIVFYPAGSGTI